MLPDPSAAVHVRDFNGNMAELAAYLKRLLDSPGVYELHRAWKHKPRVTWSSDFHNLAAIPKYSTFCNVCDYAAEHATNQHSEAFEQSSLIIGEEFGGHISNSDTASKGELDAIGSPLGFFDVNVAIGGAPTEHRVDVPRFSNDLALREYVSRICSELRADASGCQAIGAEIMRLQGEFTKRQ